MIELFGLVILIGYVIYTSNQKEKARCKAITDFAEQCDSNFKKVLDDHGMSNEDRIKNGYGKYVNK